MKAFIKNHALYMAWLIALIGLLCSVFFGELLHHEPCRLCWYQRVCLFPLVLILGIAAYKEDARIIVYAMPLALLGIFFALYQVLGIFIPKMSTPALCGYKINCSEQLMEFWGFLSFPLISLIGFLLIFFFLRLARSSSKS